jgi:hypothetical protein
MEPRSILFGRVVSLHTFCACVNGDSDGDMFVAIKHRELAFDDGPICKDISDQATILILMQLFQNKLQTLDIGELIGATRSGGRELRDQHPVQKATVKRTPKDNSPVF